MNWSSCLLLLGLHLSRCKADCVIDNRSLDTEWEKKLHKDIACSHKSNETPQNVTEISIRIIMKYFTMDTKKGVFFMYSWTRLIWMDKRLKWKPEEYGGIDTTIFWSYDIWIPILILSNKLNAEEYGSFYGECKVKNTGKVTCVHRMGDEALCAAKSWNWPYDTQNCTVEYKISSHQKNVKLVPLIGRTVSMIGAEYGAEWIIVDLHELYNYSDPVQLKITFTIERTAEGLGAIIVFPSLLLAVLTWSTMILDVNKSNRLWLTFFAVLCHFYFLTTVSEKIPKNIPDIPTIVLFYRSSLLINTVLVIVNLNLMRLRSRGTVPSNWIMSINGSVLNSFGKYVIWPRWETDLDAITSESVNMKDVQSWCDFANIINSFCLFLFGTVYAILMIIFIPRMPPNI